MKKKFHYLVLLRNLKHLLKKKSDYNIKIIASDGFVVDGSVPMGLGHLKSDKPWIIGRSFSYDMERGVRGGISGRLGPSCLRSDGFGRSGGLVFLSVLLLDGRPATKTCWVAARTSSSSIEYLLARLNKSSIVVGGFLASDSKNGVPGQMLRLKICRTASILQAST